MQKEMMRCGIPEDIKVYGGLASHPRNAAGAEELKMPGNSRDRPWKARNAGQEGNSCQKELASLAPACRGTFGGRRKAVRDRFALQGGTEDFH